MNYLHKKRKKKKTPKKKTRRRVTLVSIFLSYFTNIVTKAVIFTKRKEKKHEKIRKGNREREREERLRRGLQASRAAQ